MSSLSAHRQRDRGPGGGGGTKALTPNSVSNKNPNPALKKSSSGKENPRPVVRAQKPMMRSVPKVEKAAGENGDSRVRRSTSSVPRGRSQSPSEFIRVFSDLKKDRGSVEKKGIRDSNVKGTEFRSNEKMRFTDFKENIGFGVKSEKKSGKEMNLSRVRSSGNNNKGVILSSNSRKSGVVSINSSFESCNEKSNSDFVFKVENCVKDVISLKCGEKSEKIGVSVDLGLKKYEEKSVGESKVLEALKEKGLNEGGAGTEVGIKYPSKLHEKLTFLEGKVKRIASDIKRTKEMLDMNNPDATKVILHDIQEKISGIENAMGNVAGDSEGKVTVTKSVGNDDGSSKIVEKDQGKRIGKGLKSEELEARLFPHQKLLRNRISQKASSGSSQSHEANVVGPDANVKVEEKLLCPIEENSIALEFLASLDKDQTKVTTRAAQAGMECLEVLETDDAELGKQGLPNMVNGKGDAELILTTDESLDEFDEQEKMQGLPIGEETEDSCIYQLNEIGQKTSTGGWFVSEGESILLAHDDGSCSFYDIANCENKAVYKPPVGVSPSIWRDCWIIRAPGADGCSGRYVVAASAGNSLDSGFCSWDFYTKDVRAFHTESGGTTTSRTVLGPLPNNSMYRRNAFSGALVPETQQWWYKPCGPLIISTASSQKVVKINDIRDGEQVMKWEVQKPVLTMDYSSPLQWRNRGKVVIAEAETISLWDVNSLNPQALLSVSSSARKILAFHVNNTDAELGGGVRQRVTSAEAEGNDGVFCTHESINVLDFRHPSGVGLKILKPGINVQSVFCRGDSVFLGCPNVRSAGKKQPSLQIQQFSLRKQRLFSTYSLPESNARTHYSAITQVWGNSNLVMGASGLGLFVFDALNDDGLQSFTNDYYSSQNVREIIGPDNLYAPSFDYMASRVLLISRDRPALWRHLS